jgi:hypothetical protein
MCTSCAHYSEDEEGQPMCAAFGGPPPDEIFRDGFDHRMPFPGDNGVQFAPKGPVDVEFLDKFSQEPRPV